MAIVINGSTGITATESSSVLGDSAVETNDIADGAVTAAKLAAGAGLPDAIDVNASAPADSLNIDASGNVIVGGTTAVNTGASTGNVTINGSGNAILNYTVGGSPKGWIYHDATNFEIYNNIAGAIKVFTDGTERMRINSSGNVGIGTTSPYGLLHVAGDPTQRNSAYPGLVLANNADSYSTAPEIGIQFAAIYTADTPTDLAHISGGKQNTSSGDYGGLLKFYTRTNGNANVTERMRIDSDGRFLVGTTSAGGFITFQNSSSTTTLYANSAPHNVSGDVGVYAKLGGNCNNTASAHLRGTTDGVNNWYLYGNGTTSYSSDERLKKNIETTRDGYLDDLMALRVVKYNWYTDEDSTPKELGLIAQEVEQVFPGLVQEHELEGVGMRKNIKHSVMEFILIKAIQEQQAIIESLTARIEALENQV